MRAGAAFALERVEAAAADLHGPLLAVPDRRRASVRAAVDHAVVLGSSQPGSDVDPSRAAGLGLAVVRRRSGGGAVLVGPDDPVWVDVCVPRGDDLWVDDVGGGATWLGAAWIQALAGLGLGAGLRLHDGPMRRTPWSAAACWSGSAAGEVLVADGDAPLRKVVGISQRRTRAGAILQCACYRSWAPEPLVAALALDEGGAAALRASGAGLADLAARAGVATPSAEGVTAALVAALASRRGSEGDDPSRADGGG